jgi:hypothetical protein
MNEAQDYRIKKQLDNFLELVEIHESIRKRFRVDCSKEEVDHFIEVLVAQGRDETMLLKDIENTPPKKSPPIPLNEQKAFELFVSYYAAISFEEEKHRLKGLNNEAFKQELGKIDSWINQAEADFQLTEQEKWGFINQYKQEITEYNRFITGYYNVNLMTYDEHREGSTAANIYGRYFLLREHLISNLNADPNSKSRKVVKLKKQTLRTLWRKDESHYNRVIEYLKEINPTIGQPFIKDENSVIKWSVSKTPGQYMLAFIAACIDYRFIDAGYSVEVWTSIIKNTFGYSLRRETANKINSLDAKSDYLDAFSNLESIQ